MAKLKSAREFTPPTKATLKKYGLTEEDWYTILERQGAVCPVCKKQPSTGRWVTDHEHVRDWKDMTPERRRQFVRGLTTWRCNETFLSRGATVELLENAAQYLREYEERKACLVNVAGRNGRGTIDVHVRSIKTLSDGTVDAIDFELPTPATPN